MGFMDHSNLIQQKVEDVICNAGMSQPAKNRIWCCKVVITPIAALKSFVMALKAAFKQ